ARHPGEGGQHRRHAALDVAGAAAVEPAALGAGAERLDGHAVGRHRVLVRLEDEGGGCPGRVVPGEDVVPAGGDVLAAAGGAEAAEEGLEVVGDSAFVEVGSLQGPAHRVDAGQGDEV